MESLRNELAVAYERIEHLYKQIEHLTNHSKWDEKRMDIIGSNGNEGSHYATRPESN